LLLIIWFFWQSHWLSILDSWTINIYRNGWYDCIIDNIPGYLFYIKDSNNSACWNPENFYLIDDLWNDIIHLSTAPSQQWKKWNYTIVNQNKNQFILITYWDNRYNLFYIYKTGWNYQYISQTYDINPDFSIFPDWENEICLKDGVNEYKLDLSGKHNISCNGQYVPIWNFIYFYDNWAQKLLDVKNQKYYYYYLDNRYLLYIPQISGYIIEDKGVRGLNSIFLDGLEYKSISWFIIDYDNNQYIPKEAFTWYYNYYYKYNNNNWTIYGFNIDKQNFKLNYVKFEYWNNEIETYKTTYNNNNNNDNDNTNDNIQTNKTITYSCYNYNWQVYCETNKICDGLTNPDYNYLFDYMGTGQYQFDISLFSGDTISKAYFFTNYNWGKPNPYLLWAKNYELAVYTEEYNNWAVVDTGGIYYQWNITWFVELFQNRFNVYKKWWCIKIGVLYPSNYTYEDYQNKYKGWNLIKNLPDIANDYQGLYNCEGLSIFECVGKIAKDTWKIIIDVIKKPIDNINNLTNLLKQIKPWACSYTWYIIGTWKNTNNSMINNLANQKIGLVDYILNIWAVLIWLVLTYLFLWRRK